MIQADGVLSTPPTNTPIDTTRRRFLAVAAVASAVGAGTLAAAARAPNDVPQAVTAPRATQPACPELRVALHDLAKAHTILIGAQATNEEAEAMWSDWEVQNPQPASKRGRRKWISRGSAYHASVTAPSWQILMTAEGVFAAAQTAVASGVDHRGRRHRGHGVRQRRLRQGAARPRQPRRSNSAPGN